MASKCPRLLTTTAPTWAVEVLKTPQTLHPLHIEIFASRDLEDSSTGTANNNDSNNKEGKNNKNKDNEENNERNKDNEFPSYFLRLVTRLKNIYLDDVIEEAVEGGDGVNSYVEAVGCLDHDKAMVTAQAERNEEDDLAVD